MSALRTSPHARDETLKVQQQSRHTIGKVRRERPSAPVPTAPPQASGRQPPSEARSRCLCGAPVRAPSYRPASSGATARRGRNPAGRHGVSCTRPLQKRTPHAMQRATARLGPRRTRCALQCSACHESIGLSDQALNGRALNRCLRCARPLTHLTRLRTCISSRDASGSHVKVAPSMSRLDPGLDQVLEKHPIGSTCTPLRRHTTPASRHVFAGARLDTKRSPQMNGPNVDLTPGLEVRPPTPQQRHV